MDLSLLVVGAFFVILGVHQWLRWRWRAAWFDRLWLEVEEEERAKRQ